MGSRLYDNYDVDVDGFTSAGLNASLPISGYTHYTTNIKSALHTKKIHFGFRLLVSVPENHIQCIELLMLPIGRLFHILTKRFVKQYF